MEVAINKDEILEALQKQYPLQCQNVVLQLTVQKQEQQNAELRTLLAKTADDGE